MLRIDGGRWSLEGGRGRISSEGDLEAMPVVTGLFSAFDLRRGASPAIDVVTSAHRSRTSARQAFSWAFAGLGIAAALLLVAFAGRRPTAPRRRFGPTARSVAAHARPVDGVVASVLLAWWVLSPSFVDDGWVLTRQDQFSESGGFTNYFDTLGANVPLGYWLEWAQHWLTQSSTALLVLRIPPLLALAGIWVLCRRIVSRLPSASAKGSGVVLSALASAFLTGALAWGMTLRPEPFTALMAIGVLAYAIRFLESETAAPLVGIAVLVPFAVSGHHAGIVSLAPVLVALPSVARWARGRLLEAAALVASSFALVVVLVFVGSDVAQRRADAETFRALTSTTTSWRDEFLRYVRLSEFPSAAPLRRASVVLIGLAVLGYLLRRRRTASPLIDLPGAALGLSLILLIATPSKWPWHFGALLGIAAVAVAAETSRLRDDASGSPGWRARPLLVLGAVSLAGAWLWSPRSPWNRLDLRTLDWTLGIERSLPLWEVAFALPVMVLVVAGAVELARNGSSRLHRASWHAALYAGPVLAAPATVFTLGVLGADAVKTDAWTLARQNLETLRASLKCGLGDDVLVPDRESVRPLQGTETGAAGRVPSWIPPPPASGLRRFVLARGGGEERTPWFELPAERRFGLFVAGASVPSDTLGLEWGRTRRTQVDSLGRAETSVAFLRETGSAIPAWGFVAASELPPPPAEATSVRLTLPATAPAGAELAVTSPVVYSNHTLTRRLGPSRRTVARPSGLRHVLPLRTTSSPQRGGRTGTAARRVPVRRELMAADDGDEPVRRASRPLPARATLRSRLGTSATGARGPRGRPADPRRSPPSPGQVDRCGRMMPSTIASTTRSAARPSTPPTTSRTA